MRVSLELDVFNACEENMLSFTTISINFFVEVVGRNGPGFGSNRTEPLNHGLTVYRFKDK